MPLVPPPSIPLPFLPNSPSTEALQNYCSFTTLPSDHLQQKYLFTYDSQFPTSSSSSSSTAPSLLLDSIQHHHPLPCSPATYPAEEGPVHLMVHLGNFLNLDQILSRHLPVLVGEAMCGAGKEYQELWKLRFHEFENEIRNCYRLAFASSDRSPPLPSLPLPPSSSSDGCAV
jgi:hypothetical protein